MGLVKKIVVITTLTAGGLYLCSAGFGEKSDPIQVQTTNVSEPEEQAKVARESRQRDMERSEKEWGEWQAKLEEQRVEGEKRMQEHKEALAKRPKRKRSVRRFRWESPAAARGRVWNIPEEEGDQSVLNAFLRVCIAEADGMLQDCVGIWQVVSNIRQRSCNRGSVRRITECTAGEDGEETMLSAFRRAQSHVLGMIKPRNFRVRWISNITTECEPPENWPHSEARWDSQYAKRCQHVVELGRHLLKGELPPSRPGARLKRLPGRPIAWGGRCESGKASCDDYIACARGLVRVPGVESTANAFWCRSGQGICQKGVDPICEALGESYRKGRKGANKSHRSSNPSNDGPIEVSQRDKVSAPQS